MEHRQSQRLSVDAKLKLYRRGKPLGIGRIREISRDGLFVAADIAAASPNQVLEFELLSEERPAGQSPRGKAVVVHNTDQGLGLMLPEGQHQAGIRELYSWLLRRQRKSQSRAAREADSGRHGSRGTTRH